MNEISTKKAFFRLSSEKGFFYLGSDG